MKSEGEKTPPEAPDPRVRQVAMNFSAKSSKRNQGSASTRFKTSTMVA